MRAFFAGLGRKGHDKESSSKHYHPPPPAKEPIHDKSLPLIPPSLLPLHRPSPLDISTSLPPSPPKQSFTQSPTSIAPTPLPPPPADSPPRKRAPVKQTVVIGARNSVVAPRSRQPTKEEELRPDVQQPQILPLGEPISEQTEKHVAFISPPSTPASLDVLSVPLPSLLPAIPSADKPPPVTSALASSPTRVSKPSLNPTPNTPSTAPPLNLPASSARSSPKTKPRILSPKDSLPKFSTAPRSSSTPSTMAARRLSVDKAPLATGSRSASSPYNTASPSTSTSTTIKKGSSTPYLAPSTKSSSATSTRPSSTTRSASAVPHHAAPPSSMKSAQTSHETSRPSSAFSNRRIGGGGGSHDEGGSNNGSWIGPAGSWSEWADQDLLMNLGPRERTRQEVLWEIVSSEERYVEDLRQLVNTFIDSLLPPRPQVSSPTIQLSSWTSPLGSGPTLPNPSSSPWTPTDLISSSHHNNSSYSPPSSSRPHPPVRALSAEPPRSHTANNSPAIEDLPIAARFLSVGPASSPPVLSQGPEFSNSTVPRGGTAGTIPYGQIEQHQHPSLQQPKANISNQLPTRSHASLPPPPRNYPHPSPDLRSTSNGSSRKSAKPSSSSGAGGREEAIVDLGLPDDLRAVLEVLRDGVYEGHLALSRALKKRYDEQYPLVRSLADVFTQHSYVLREYNIYVLHLSNALGIVDSALTSGAGKKAQKAEAGTEVERLRRVFQELDELAADRGESGLAISLSKPFQRLLKYPLLLQNLLYNTDPSTREYEATVAMVEDVENIIRSIEDEKTAVEERVKTRDVFARIEGLEREKVLIAPKPSRILIDESPCGLDGTKISAAAAARRTTAPVKEKKTFRRLSDILKPTVGGEKDLWIVKFTDVSLLCQRTGTTVLPLASTASNQTATLPELNGKVKSATTGRKHTQAKPRNLYRFVKIEDWAMSSQTMPRHGMTSMDDISRIRTGQPHSGPLGSSGNPDERDEDDEDGDGDGSDASSFGAKSRMSFSYWGGDKIESNSPPLPSSGFTSPSSTPNPTSSSAFSSAPPDAKPNPRRTASALSNATTTTATGSRRPSKGSSGNGNPPLLIRRSSAKEKFGNRMRSPEPTAAEIRAASRASSTGRRAGVGLGIAGGGGGSGAGAGVKPAWNSSATSATSAAAPARSRAPLLQAGRTSTKPPTTSAAAAITPKHLP